MPTAHAFLSRLNVQYPIIQAPMAGTSTPELAAAVSNAGGMGSLGLGNLSVEAARAQIRQLQALTDNAFNINFFCHQPEPADATRDQAWLQRLTPWFSLFNAQPPAQLEAGYDSFTDNRAMLDMLLEERPPVVSFHFGVPDAEAIAALHAAGILLMGCATSLAEAQLIEAAGLDAVIAQGYEAGGHRGLFDPQHDPALGLLALLDQLQGALSLPVIAAGGLMDGKDMAAALARGACAAQLGTAFISCPESAAPAAYRAQLLSERAEHTRVTAIFSGRPARGIVNRSHREIGPHAAELAGYPQAYSAAKALHAAAAAQDCHEFAPYWAGTGAHRSRALPAAQLVATLMHELTGTGWGPVPVQTPSAAL